MIRVLAEKTGALMKNNNIIGCNKDTIFISED